MFIEIDPANATPAHRQIMEQIRGQCAAGKLKVGDRLPGSRALAVQSGVSPNTALRAYERLASQGILQLRPREGAFVAQIPPESPLEAYREEMTRDLSRLIVRSLALGMTTEDFLDAFDAALASVAPEPTKDSEAQP